MGFPQRPLLRLPTFFQPQRLSKRVSCLYGRLLGSIGSELNARGRPGKRFESEYPRTETRIRAAGGNICLDAYLDARGQRCNLCNQGLDAEITPRSEEHTS